MSEVSASLPRLRERPVSCHETLEHWSDQLDRIGRRGLAVRLREDLGVIQTLWACLTPVMFGR